MNCNGSRGYRIVFDPGLDVLDRCPGAASAASGGDASVGVLQVLD
jgi:hypothetical protein